ncbi:glutathione S-transferase family protein [Litorisediminicola beolgyonensis]|uniref:Glutathione S-transferase family protein n=1 Tax=Litorisediminicola beolgyonensis TaxID=1173614 RepID=A0ABW3ZEC6_9RHOB
MADRPILYHIPACPFSQRLEILLALKGRQDAVEMRVVDITKPRDPDLLKKTRGTTALPVLEMPDGRVLKESLVLLEFFDLWLGGPSIRRADPFERAAEALLVTLEGPFTGAGYLMVMNQDRAKRQEHLDKLLEVYTKIEGHLEDAGGPGPFLFEEFGYAECVFTPMFMRFWFLDYYEDFTFPESGFARVAAWREACLAHPAAQQVSREEIVKLYYDYAQGSGNGALPEGRTVSSFSFEPDWRDRPWPPTAKYGTSASDAELGLV